MRKYTSPKTGVPLLVLQKKRGVGLRLHLFLEAELLELRVLAT